MNRRRLTKLAALSLAGLALPVAWLARRRADALFTDLFGDADIAAAIGAARLRDDPEAGTRGRALAADLAERPPAARARHLRRHVHADLGSLDVVVVDGWVMAKAEADLCAAVHLDRALS